MENNITKRHQNYVTFEDKVTNCIEQDHYIFNTAFKCIHFIGSLLTDDAYESVRDGLRTVKNNTDPATWTWPTHVELLKHLHNLNATTDISWEAKMQLDKLTMGNTPFPNFLSTFNRLADRCKRQPVQKVELLKAKVSKDLLQNTILKGMELEDDEFDSWCKLFQKTWKGMETIKHINHMTEGKRPVSNQATTPKTQPHPAAVTAAPHPDAMDLSAIRQPAHNHTARPPPGTDSRQWCTENSCCFYCKLPGHRLSECEEKKNTDNKRAQGLLPARPQYNVTFPRPSRAPPAGFQFYNGYTSRFNAPPLYPASHQTYPMQNRAHTGGFVDDNSIHSFAASPSASPSITPSQSISRSGTPHSQGN
ncbi:hypothetical protein Ptr902_09607 [Pyrenophora tritici-repentis]|nr:hypothetical protein L13192_12706 [Pyrenophora tritici-repentis]KAI1663309.1 hypothetical protein L13192_12661 [Pyrenophora tritici-repentis]KAI2478975.1 hypothetical protein Ptr902_09941 [Pyrenophora tritici-repentis]KAI2479396.1 hypothetical protein Ptr902_09607 [Pyrenophora tritici-repentis]